MNDWAKERKKAGDKVLVLYMPASMAYVSRRMFESFLNMMHPQILDDLYRFYQIRVIPMVHKIMPLDLNRNDAFERAVHDYQADYIMSCDADMVFPIDTLPKLIAQVSDRYPVVTGVYYRKSELHYPVIGRYVDWCESLELKRESLKKHGFITDSGDQCLYFKPVNVDPMLEPFEVDVFGAGCFLVKTTALESLKQPYFRYFNGYMDGDHSLGRISEDMAFCASLKKAGLKVLCVPSCQAGHLSEVLVAQSDFRPSDMPEEAMSC